MGVYESRYGHRTILVKERSLDSRPYSWIWMTYIPETKLDNFQLGLFIV